MNEKYKAKIRKLLALAQSDNPHEAERARIQAEKMMAKHNIDQDGLGVVTVQAKLGFKRRKPRHSESTLVTLICGISGCHSFLSVTRTRNGDSYKYQSYVEFMGLQPDAEMAAYTWDVLYRQLQDRERELKREYGFTAKHLDRYAHSWALGVAKQVSQVFGWRDPVEAVEKAVRQDGDGMAQVRTRSVQSTGCQDIDQALTALGTMDGRSAQLHNATGDQTLRPKALPGGGQESSARD